MSHTSVKVEPHEARYICDECEKTLRNPGYMKFTGYSRSGTYHHQCDICRFEKFLPHKYPYIFYYEITQTEAE